MRKYVLLICGSLINIGLCCAQSDDANLTYALKAKLIADKDTLSLSGPISFTLTIKNCTKPSVYIPSGFTLFSNLYPNGTSDIISGGRISYKLTPFAKFASIYEENIISKTPKVYIEIRSRSSQVFKIDITHDISAFNKESDDNSKIKPGRTYKLALNYSNYNKMKGNEAATFLGNIKSNSVKFFLSK